MQYTCYQEKNAIALNQKHITCLSLKLQLNTFNSVTDGEPQKSGHINAVQRINEIL